MNKIFLYIVMSVISILLLSKVSWSQIATLLKVHVVDYSGGQVSKYYPDQLTNAQSPLIQNAEINTKGQLTTRLGQALFNVDTATTTNPTAAFGGVGTYYFQNGST